MRTEIVVLECGVHCGSTMCAEGCWGMWNVMAVSEEVGRDEKRTEAEKLTDKIVGDLKGIGVTGRQRVKSEIDKIDAPPTAEKRSDGALGNISRRGGY